MSSLMGASGADDDQRSNMIAIISSPSLADHLSRGITPDSVVQASSEKLLALLVERIDDVIDQSAVMSVISQLIAVDCIALSEAASAAAVCLCRRDIHLIRQLLDRCESQTSSSEIRCRFASIFQVLMADGDSTFNYCLQNEIVGVVLNLSKTPDILVQLISLEYLSSFAKTKSGLTYAFTSQIPQYLASLSSGEGSGSEICIRTMALQILAKLFSDGYSIDNGQTIMTFITPDILSYFCKAIDMNMMIHDDSCKLSALNSLAIFASTCTPWLKLVLEDKPLLTNWLAFLNSKVDIQVVALNTISSVLMAVYSGDEDTDTEMKKQLFSEMNLHRKDLVVNLIAASKRPFPDIKQSSYNMLAAIGSRKWGLILLLNVPGFSTYITDLSLEYSRDAKLWKFGVITSISNNPMLRVLSPDICSMYEAAAQRGPFFVTPQVAGPLVMDA
jgi:hypothetical protein